MTNSSHVAAKLYFRGAVYAVLVYDITSRQSFDELKDWMADVWRESPETEMVIVGSKADLAHLRAVDLDEAQEAVAEWEWEHKHPPPSPLARSQTLPVQGSRPGPSRLGSTSSTTVSPPSFSRTSTTASQHGGRSRANSHLATPSLSVSVRPGMTQSSSTYSLSPNPLPEEGLLPRTSSNYSILSMGWRGRAAEDAAAARLKLEEQERAGLLREQKLAECTIPISEASALTDDGIEDVFLEVARRLIERKDRIAADQVLRRKQSFKIEAPPPESQAAPVSSCC